MNINEIVNFLWVFYIFLGVLFLIQLFLFWKEIKKKTLQESEETKVNNINTNSGIINKKDSEKENLNPEIEVIDENHSNP